MKSEQTSVTEIPYVHKQDVHNLESPLEIVKVLVDIFRPSSVVDVGCGIGTFVHAFKSLNVPEVVGIDGPWVKKELLTKYMDLNNFVETDLQKRLKLDRKFDMAISLEVAEHLEEKYADIFVANLTALSDVIVFSAAIPGQPGQNHINCQWISYWQEKFEAAGFQVLDLLRPLFWHNNKIFYWYRQNMFLVIKKGTAINHAGLSKHSTGKLMESVHPELLKKYSVTLNDITSSKKTIKYYFNLLMKSIVSKIKAIG
jgi:SAM-dependent methyltransferase